MNPREFLLNLRNNIIAREVPAKPFSQQFRECKAAGVQILGEPVTDIAVRYYIDDGQGDTKCMRGPKEITSRPYVCGKFGGLCSSGNEGCIKLRAGQ